ncbi:MAG: hypothetical protein ACJAZQ_002211 [Cognaticolwellia sp.]|jgi:hypothetical protein
MIEKLLIIIRTSLLLVITLPKINTIKNRLETQLK